MKVTEKQPFLLLPVDDYRADLRIIDSEGKSMIILSDNEFEQVYGKPLTKITEIFLDRIKSKTSKNTQRLTKNYRVIAVMLNQQYDEYYEKVKVTWTHKSKIDNFSGNVAKLAKIDLFIPRFGFTHSKTSAIYLSFKTSSTYRIYDEPKIKNWAKTGSPKYKEILNSVAHKVYRFQETDQPQLIQITVMVGLPNTVIRWTKVGLILGTVIPTYMLGYLLFYGYSSVFALESLAGVMALLIGERVLVLKDIPLMKGWSNLNIGLVIWTLIVLIAIIIASNGSNHPTNLACLDPCESSTLNELKVSINDLNEILKQINSESLPLFGTSSRTEISNIQNMPENSNDKNQILIQK